MIRDHFGDMDGLKDKAIDAHPEKFEDIITLEYFTSELHREQQKAAAEKKVHYIATAVGGGPIHEEFLASLLNACDERDGMLWVIPANYALKEIDKELIRNPRVNIVFRPIRLNKKCVINPIQIDPKQVDPVVGLDAFAHDEGTLIIGSPKQRRVPLANAQGKISPVIQATGAVTRPRYFRNGGQKRRDSLAEVHHVMGCVVVEIQDEKIHYPRNIMMCRDGSFNDIDKNYASDEIKKIEAAAVIPGDWHVGATNEQVREVILNVCDLVKPDYLALHDFTDFSSINPHEEENVILRALRHNSGLTLDSEFKANAEELALLRHRKPAKKAILLVDSNHPDFLPRYLKKGKFDDANRIVATELQLLALKGLDPYEQGLRKLYGVEPGRDLKFLSQNEEFRVAGVELAAHGHRGANGKKSPGAKGMFKSYGKVSFGHCHHGEIWHGAISSGTSTEMNLGYNPGQSNWDHSFQILHKDGTRQLINIINGAYQL